MKQVMVCGLTEAIYSSARLASLDIRSLSSPDSHEINVLGLPGRKLITYDATFALDGGGFLQITEKKGDELSREVSLRGVLSAAASRLPKQSLEKLLSVSPREAVDGPRILEGTVSFEPVSGRTFLDYVLGRSQRNDHQLAELAAADVITGFRRAFQRKFR